MAPGNPNNGTWKSGKMVVETSPDNYQAWIHSNRQLSLDEKRFRLKKLCNDPGADPKTTFSGRRFTGKQLERPYCGAAREKDLVKWYDQ